jgi:hypothetical protein
MWEESGTLFPAINSLIFNTVYMKKSIYLITKKANSRVKRETLRDLIKALDNLKPSNV